MRISNKVDYGIRVTTTIAEMERLHPGQPIARSVLAERDDLPSGFLVDILGLLRNAGLLKSHRGGEGGWTLARPASSITVADIIRALDGPLASVRGVPPHDLGRQGAREPFISMWIAVRASLRSILEHITVDDLASGELPSQIARIAADPDAWDPHRPDPPG